MFQAVPFSHLVNGESAERTDRGEIGQRVLCSADGNNVSSSMGGSEAWAEWEDAVPMLLAGVGTMLSAIKTSRSDSGDWNSAER